MSNLLQLNVEVTNNANKYNIMKYKLSLFLILLLLMQNVFSVEIKKSSGLVINSIESAGN